MALYMARDDLTGTFFPDRGFGHLFLIVNNDGGLGETDNPIAYPKGLLITYARADPGLPAVRIDTLANALPPTAPNVDIKIFPVNANFVLKDGSPIYSFGGISMPVGSPLNPTVADIATIYDTSQCAGSGYWVRKKGGGNTGDPSEVILYHELSHCFHYSSGTVKPTSGAEETAAEKDENDLRDQEGLPDRKVSSHRGGCGGGPSGCCIVASIASGSAFSPEVNRLREVRDYLIRGTRVGDCFIDRLHYQYYAFSPEVCRAMANAPDLRDQIRDRWVVPLIFALELAVFAAEFGFEPAAIGRKLDEQLADSRLGGRVDSGSAAALAVLVATALSCGTVPPITMPASAAELIPLLRDRLAGAEHVRWALLRIVGIWAGATARRLNGEPQFEIGCAIREDLENWLADAPVDDVWNDLGAAQTEVELESLGSSVFRTAAARDGFAKRVAMKVPRLAPVLENWVRREDGVAEQEAWRMTKKPHNATLPNRPRKSPAKKERSTITEPRLPLNLVIEPSGSSVEGDWIILRYVLSHSSPRTLHAYARVRRIEMDQATGLLKLSLDDSHVGSDSILDAHLQEPPFIAVGGGEATTLELRVPRRISMLPKAARGEVPKVQIEDLEGFRRIDLRIAYSDTPFYDKPGDKTTGAQLRAWAKGIAELSHTSEQIGWRAKPTVR